MLIVYHSLTGNTKACSEALKEALAADILEIKDLTDRSGGFGFFRSAIGSLLGMHTGIAPENPDLSAYNNIIIAAPIWTGKLSMAARTFIDKNRFDGKKVAAVKAAPWECSIPASFNISTGRKSLKATAYSGGKAGTTITRFMIVLSEIVPERYRYKVIHSYPHDRDAFTQGLLYDNGVLYESTPPAAGATGTNAQA